MPDRTRFRGRLAGGGTTAARAARLSFEPLEPRLQLDAGSLVISEFMAANDATLPDGRGEYEDWIEIFNAGDATVDLAGWYLSDDPGDLSKWTFPSRELDAGTFLVVFASGQPVDDYVDPDGNLHTNFRIDADGGYLALVEPGGNAVASEFTDFPEQVPDVSYGLDQQVTVTPLIGPDTPAKVWIPGNDSLARTWTGSVEDEPFDDSLWTAGVAAIGYETEGVPSPVNIAPMGVATQSTIYSGSFPASAALDGSYSNFTHTANQPNSYWQLVLPGPEVLSSIVLRNRVSCCAIRLSNFRLSVFDDAMNEVYGEDFFTPAQGGGYPGLGASLTVGLPAGTMGNTIRVQLLGYNNEGTGYLSLAEVEIFPSSGYHGLIGTDLRAAMEGINASAYLRVPFDVAASDLEGPAALDFLNLKMQYDDGFVAYLNGREVARRNDPPTLAFDAAAPQEHPDEEAVVAELFPLTQHLDALRAGENVLAIHGLNRSAGDVDFLIVPELEGLTAPAGDSFYFPVPTPGEWNSDGVLGFVADTQFDVDRGFFVLPIDVTVSVDTPDVEIRYTTDGRPPTATSGTVYEGPIHVDHTTTLRVAAFKEDYWP